ncbi:hypothetical protein [Leptospira biflexa]|uniref:hypothetical protein n=1 Tax=Leptospira biflexa TaxID=172 RepID=UPI00108264E2|nr:hypothetical protein [Leptospira biflexa]TGM30723.1 hypothetical protein EHQ89_18080 [Leptospira biflexa]TGM34767.1 hypothetical protein EHQ80_14060 [Leptospira biflexa]
MKDEIQKDTVLLSGVSKQVPAGTPFTACLTIQNSSGQDLELLALTFRYKAGLENCLIKIETPNQKNDPILLGECTLGGLGSPYDSPGYARFHIPGKKPRLTSGQNLVVEIQTFATGLNARDINLLVDGQAIEKK